MADDFDLNPFGNSGTNRANVPAAESILYKPFQCLDHGFVRLIDYMGDDNAVVQAARVSYGKGTKKVSEDEGLIRYLMRHRHTTPFEMVELKFHAKMPMFVARQWVRHRTASINEYSARYSIVPDQFYIPTPEDLGIQAKNNRQGRDQPVTSEQSTSIIKLLMEDSERNYDHYKSLLNEDPENQGVPEDPNKPMLARELARMGLSLNFYTEWYWKSNLHNVFHFLGLRMDPHAQKEMRVYADAMSKIVKAVAPISYNAFEDYRLNSTSLSALDSNALARVINGEDKKIVASQVFKNGREREEFLSKLEKLTKA